MDASDDKHYLADEIMNVNIKRKRTKREGQPEGEGRGRQPELDLEQCISTSSLANMWIFLARSLSQYSLQCVACISRCKNIHILSSHSIISCKNI